MPRGPYTLGSLRASAGCGARASGKPASWQSGPMEVLGWQRHRTDMPWGHTVLESAVHVALSPAGRARGKQAGLPCGERGWTARVVLHDVTSC